MIVHFSYLRVLEKSQPARTKTGGLFAQLVKSGRIQLEDYCAGLEGILAQADDLKIDIPKIWDYLAEILGERIIINLMFCTTQSTVLATTYWFSVTLVRDYEGEDSLTPWGFASEERRLIVASPQ